MVAPPDDLDLLTPARRIVVPNEAMPPESAATGAGGSCEVAGGDLPFTGGRRFRAAQYIRMSTEYQQYSTANQVAAIADYAAAHGLEIVRTYSDEARSGLSLKWRPGLRQMLADVIGGRADYAMGRRNRLVTEYRSRVLTRLADLGVPAARERPSVLVIAGRLQLGVALAPFRPWRGLPRWRAMLQAQPHPDWLLIARLDPLETGIMDQSLIPGGQTWVALDAQRHWGGRVEERYVDLDPALRRVAGLAEIAGARARAR